MPEVPSDFIQLMQQQLGDQEAAQLLHAITATESPVSVRLNPTKMARIEEAFGGDSAVPLTELTPVPWCAAGYYLPERPQFTLDPLFHAGCYYVQEASSMYIEHAWRIICNICQQESLPSEVSSPSLIGEGCQSSVGSFGGERLSLLDLCAAPGGKSTLWRSVIGDDALLVANEPDRKRAEILNENLQKWGHPNVMVTNAYAADFAAYAPSFFDVVAADVPCSGEGMFRKDPASRDEWSMENVLKCAALQRSIIEDVWPALKPGGFLVYSTCTYNHLEDEDNVHWIASELGADILEERHFFPHCDRGEGFYLCLMRKQGEAPRKSRRPHLEHIRHFDWTPYELKGRKQIPQHILAMNPDTAAQFPQCELSREQALQYLRREAITLPADQPRGYVIVCYEGHPLGFVNNLGTRANNMYPQEWRIRHL